MMPVTIECGTNPYRANVQGKVNEPITIADLLDRAEQFLGVKGLDHSLEAIYDRLEGNTGVHRRAESDVDGGPGFLYIWHHHPRERRTSTYLARNPYQKRRYLSWP